MVLVKVVTSAIPCDLRADVSDESEVGRHTEVEHKRTIKKSPPRQMDRESWIRIHWHCLLV